ncbi:hypothetical protein [Umezawaea sp. Da 62-37]|uniref:hypothetical protein n=1 Tax=Umezawaea sp. Da 62-37 TaxID=3075927 RepID=UPI0028F72BC7|nr:hypothetical protein [Umezawaea sp. Da 62-37]WNV86564.1 hypothetical protein RM788_52050 [Umezawaea sp. Da 62-37]
MPSLWIGPPGRMREIPDAATDFDRTVSLGVQEFQAMGGGVTVTSIATPPRRLLLSWTALPIDHVDWLDSLARRVFGPSPLAVVDPAARNLLGGAQSQGYGPLSAWELTGPGSLVRQADRTVTITGTTTTSLLRWRHPYWPGWPILAGQVATFTSSLASGSHRVGFEWLDASGAVRSRLTTNRPPMTTVPDTTTAVFARPVLELDAITTPIPLGTSLLRFADPTTPIVLGPVGDGLPAMAVTSYTDKPTTAATTRDLSLSLVEVRRAGS